jgi:DNA-binding transcriptional MerR regulator
MTQLSIKTLRHYHEVGLLEPTHVDEASGYRFYATDLVPSALLIRRLRTLEMPVVDVRSVLNAQDGSERNSLISKHLERMEGTLRQTQTVVSDLRVMLGPSHAPVLVERRSVPDTLVAAITENVAIGELVYWWQEASAELRALARQTGTRVNGFLGGLYAPELYIEEFGEVSLFLPISEPLNSGRVSTVLVPGAHLAVAVHRGSYAGIDRTYGALGSWVADSGIGRTGPIRENYLLTSADTSEEQQLRTEICWPVTGPDATNH